MSLAFPGRRSFSLALLAALAFQVDPASANDHSLPYVPTSADVVLQRVPSVSDSRVRRLDQLRTQQQATPKDVERALKLADAYVDYGRSTGDARYLGRALAVIEPWMHEKEVPVPVLLVHATILQSRHFFQSSRAELQAILARSPDNAQAWLTIATVAMVQGDYSAANDACVHLASLTDFMGMLCTAQLRALTGHAEQAYALLAFIEHPGPQAPVAVNAYVEGLMADTARRLGKFDAAEAHFKQALQWAPGDNFLLADYGDFLLDRNRPRDVIALVKNYAESDTSFLRMVFAEAAIGSPDTSRDIGLMQARFAAMDQRGSHVYDRERAGFVLYLKHDPAGALKLARQNWSAQRAPQDMRIFLEAALTANEPRAAAPVLALLEQSRLEDPVVRNLADRVSAAIHEARGPVPTQTGSHP